MKDADMARYTDYHRLWFLLSSLASRDGISLVQAHDDTLKFTSIHLMRISMASCPDPRPSYLPHGSLSH